MGLGVSFRDSQRLAGPLLALAWRRLGSKPFAAAATTAAAAAPAAAAAAAAARVAAVACGPCLRSRICMWLGVASADDKETLKETK